MAQRFDVLQKVSINYYVPILIVQELRHDQILEGAKAIFGRTLTCFEVNLLQFPNS